MHKAIVLVFILSGMKTFAQGINFLNDSSWSIALKEAAANNKLLFVDVYTNWCKPCKEMDKTVFNKKEVGDMYNKDFINIKINAESSIGEPIARQYGVTGYPTYLFISGNGELVYKFSGLEPVHELIRKGNIALGEKNNTKPIGKWMMDYSSNKNNKAFMYEYLMQRSKLQLESTEEFDQYLSLLAPSKQLSDSTISLILMNTAKLDIYSNVFKLLWIHYHSLVKNGVYTEKLNKLLELSMRMGSHAIYKSGSEEALHTFLELNKTSPERSLSPQNWEHEEVFYRLNKRPQDYLKIVVPKLEAQLTLNAIKNKRAEELEVLATCLNNAASFLFMYFNDKPTLNRAHQLISSATELKPSLYPTQFLIWRTYANVLYKLGNKQQAIENMKKAIDLITEDDSRFNFKEHFKNDLDKMEKGLPTWEE